MGNELGRPLTPRAAAHWWCRNRDALGLPDWTLHQFRHQFATNLARNDVNPRTMAALLGHNSPMISLQIYTHVEKGQTEDAIARVWAAKAAVSDGPEPDAESSSGTSAGQASLPGGKTLFLTDVTEAA